MADIDEQQTEETEEPAGRSAAELLEAAPDDDLLSHPVIAAKIEERVFQRAEEQRRADDERRRLEAEQAEQQRMRNLRRTDPLGYVNELDRIEAGQAERDAERERWQRVANVEYADLEQRLLPEALAPLRDKSWTAPTFEQAWTARQRDIAAAEREDARLRALKAQESGSASSGASRTRGGKDFADEESMAAAWQSGQIDDTAMRSWYARHGGLRTR